MEKFKAHRHYFLLAAILALALILRLWGLRFGLPYVGFQPDEWFIADEGLMLLRDGFSLSKLTIGNLHAYIHAGIGWLVFEIVNADPNQLLTYREMRTAESIRAGVIGVPHPVPAYYLWGRITTAVMGVISLWLTYQIGREVEVPAVGLMGALFLAASPLHAEYSHYLIRTIPGLMFLLLAFYVILLAYLQERWWFYTIGGVLAALAVLVKQNNLIILAPLGLALGMSLWRTARQRSLSKALPAIGATLLALVIGGLVLALALGYKNPTSFYSGVLGRIWNNSYVFGGHHFGFSGDNTLLWILNYFVRDPWRFVFLLALPGAVVAALELRDRGWLLLAIPVPYLFMMSFFTVRFLHWLIPVLPFMSILAGVFLAWGGRWAGQRLRLSPIPWQSLTAVVALAITLTSFKLIVVQDYWFSQKDVRVIASEWLQENISSGTKVVIETYGPYLPSEACQVEYIGSVAQKDIETYQTEGVDYLVINELQYRRTQVESASALGDPIAKEYLARYRSISDELPLTQEFVGPAIIYPRRWVRVYGMQKEQ